MAKKLLLEEGDWVYDDDLGQGVVVEIDYSDIYPVRVRFNDGLNGTFTLTGRYYKHGRVTLKKI